MNRNFGIFLGLLVVSLAVWVGYVGSTRVQYFPPALVAPTGHCTSEDGQSYDWPVINEVEAEWYPEYWRAADEPSLYLASIDPETTHKRTVRFSYFPSFVASVVVRLDEISPAKLRMTATKFGATAFFGRSVTGRVSRMLTPNEVRRVETILAEVRPFALSPPMSCEFGMDGSQWVLESSGPEGYRYVSRWSPRTGPMRETGLVFLGLTGWDVEVF